jgi:hypothetical protein
MAAAAWTSPPTATSPLAAGARARGGPPLASIPTISGGGASADEEGLAADEAGNDEFDAGVGDDDVDVAEAVGWPP